MKDLLDHSTIDYLGDTMYRVNYQFSHPSGRIHSTSRWTEAKDETEAKQIVEQQIKPLHKWYKITRVTKLTAGKL